VTLDGELKVRLAWDGRRVLRVDVESTRSPVAGRLMVGRRAGDAATLLPRLYSICGHAQRAAACCATAAAGAAVPAEPRAVHETAVLLETVQEYLWRLLIDWPQAMGHPPAVEAVAAVRKTIAPALARMACRADPSPLIAPDLAAAWLALAAQHVYGEPVAQWLLRSAAAGFDDWVASAPTLPARLARELRDRAPYLGLSATSLMPPATASLLQESLLPAMDADPDFAQAPLLCGMTVETGALARTCEHPIVAFVARRDGHTVATRMTARLVELAVLLARLCAATPVPDGAVAIGALATAPGVGVATVETARGLLLHRARVADGVVTGYEIVAPTEWNFHPAGPLVQGLEGTEAGDAETLERYACLVIQALDPCVAFRVEVGHA
jgi:Ni,Fe-hydrogenase I large subunit